MSEPVSINPDGLRNAANQFDDISDTTRRILNTLTGGCNAEGEPWGDDKAGKKFSEGSQGYLANRDGTFKSLGQLVDLFGQNRDNLRDSAKTFEQNESQVTNSTPSGSGNVPSGSGSGSSSSSYTTPLQPRLQATRTQLQPRQYAEATPETPAEPLQPREYAEATPETPAEPLQPREYAQTTPETAAVPREYSEIPASQTTPVGQTTPGTPLQPREYSSETLAQPLQPRQYSEGIPATQPRLSEATESIPATPLQPREHGQEIPATQPRVYETTQATPEVYAQPLQPREYAEIPATEGETTPETYRTLDEPLQTQQAFPRIQVQT